MLIAKNKWILIIERKGMDCQAVSSKMRTRETARELLFVSCFTK